MGASRNLHSNLYTNKSVKLSSQNESKRPTSRNNYSQKTFQIKNSHNNKENTDYVTATKNIIKSRNEPKSAANSRLGARKGPEPEEHRGKLSHLTERQMITKRNSQRPSRFKELIIAKLDKNTHDKVDPPADKNNELKLVQDENTIGNGLFTQ